MTGPDILFNAGTILAFIVDLKTASIMKSKQREIDLKIGRPRRPVEELRMLISEFEARVSTAKDIMIELS